MALRVMGTPTRSWGPWAPAAPVTFLLSDLSWVTCLSGPRLPPLFPGAPGAWSHQIRSGTARAGVWGPPRMTSLLPPTPVSPQSLAEGPPSQPGPSRLRPAEEELPPPPEEPVGFLEREASTGKGTGLGV